MIVTPTEIAGVCELAVEPHYDARGFFARLFCAEELARAGIEFTSTQINLSRNIANHTLRGMHYQAAPYAEAKIVRVTRGAIFDVVVDLRENSATYRHWLARNLNATSGNALFISEGCAHGFLTLTAETDVFYQMGRPHSPGRAQGFRYDDPKIGIVWPQEPAVIASADETWPPL